jgi:flagellar biogenesis protein FliO
MDTLRQAGGAVAVLALLLLCLWWLRRKGLATPVWRGPGRVGRQLESIERLPLTPNHSLHLVRWGAHDLLIASSPAGCVVLQRGGAAASNQERGAA